ncbi:MAG: type VII secretion protein EccB [Nocardioides sp.]
MSTKRDLVEAHAFSRRRLVTAFVSGAPGGREVEPNRPGRAIIGGVALAILLVAGAAIAGVFSPRTPANWRDSGIVIAKESGNNYVVLEDDDPLRPTDPVSARLIFGSDTEVRNVAQDEINKVEIGDDIGIFGAPDSLPSTSLLVDSGWSACMNDQGGSQFRIDRRPATEPAPSAAVTVTGSDGRRYLVASSGNGSGAFRLALGTGRRANGILARLGLASAPTYDVPDEWLNLFPSGPALSTGSFGISRVGSPAPYADRLGDPSLEVGQLVTYVGKTYVLGAKKPIEVRPFAAAVYEIVSGESPAELDAFDETADSADDLAVWPAAEPVALDAEPCAVLDAAQGRASRTQLATAPRGEASAAAVGDAIRYSVAPGQGAYVRTAGHGDATGGQQWVIDSGGTRYRLGGKGVETADLLGYAGYDVPTIPDAWVEQFGCGPELSNRAAMAEPDAEAATGSCEQ